MSDNFLPNRDAELRTWSAVFSAGINAAAVELGLSVEAAEAYAELNDQFAAALAAATEPRTRTRGTVLAKNDLRTLLRRDARRLARIVRAQPSVTATQRVNLGLAARLGGGGASAAIRPPEESPMLQIVYTSGRLVNVRLGRSGRGRGRPDGAQGAVVFSFAGNLPPGDPSLWQFERCTSRTRFDIEIPNRVAPGSKVHLAAAWYNPRGDRGPMSASASTYIGDGVAKAA